MLMKKTFKPWACASNDKTREILNQFCALEIDKPDVAEGLLVTTDGRALTQIPVEIEAGDVAGLVPFEAIKAAVKLAGKLLDARVDCTSAETVKLSDGRTWPRIAPHGMKWPNWRQVLPAHDAARQRLVRVHLNPVLLANIFASWGNPEASGAVLEFQIDGEDDARQTPIRVTSRSLDAVLMPIKSVSRAPNRIDDIDAAQAEYGNTSKNAEVR